MLPSIGSISMPADVPHFLPEGSLPQFWVTIGAGLGRPSPVIGLPTVPESGEHAANRTRIEVKSAGIRTRGEDRGEDMGRSPCRGRGCGKISLWRANFTRAPIRFYQIGSQL